MSQLLFHERETDMVKPNDARMQPTTSQLTVDENGKFIKPCKSFSVAETRIERRLRTEEISCDRHRINAGSDPYDTSVVEEL